MNAYEPEVKPCPRCSGEMAKLDTVAALPKVLHPEKARAVGDPTPAISISDVWCVEIYFCQTCRHVELYAA